MNFNYHLKLYEFFNLMKIKFRKSNKINRLNNNEFARTTRTCASSHDACTLYVMTRIFAYLCC